MRVLPTHVGMSPDISQSRISRIRAPRACGDEPTAP